jgi:putative ABC transport system permease protein
VTADYIVDSEQTSLSPELGERLAALPEVDVVSAMRAGEFQLDGETAVEALSAIDSATIGATSDLGYSEGALDRLRDGGVLVSEARAEEEGWQVGDVLPMRFARTGVQRVAIDGTYAADTLEAQGFLLSMHDFEANYTDQLDIRVLVSVAEGVRSADARAAVEGVVGAFPNARVQSNDEYKADFRDRLDIALAIVAVVLGLAVLIAVLGIVNTLALSILERTRELGLLRAVGMTQKQVRAMIRSEAVTIAVIGGVLGLVVGVQVGVTLAGLLGVDQVTFPWVRLALFLVFAVIAGVGAAVLPARRAARLDVLAAVSHT